MRGLVAVLLPVIVRNASDSEAPIYGMDVQEAAEWKEGDEARGVRTHFVLGVSIWKREGCERDADLDRMISSRSTCSQLLWYVNF